MQQDHLSIMLPAYGDNPLLRTAVDGVLHQDCPDWTLQVLDDGPEDPSLAAWFAGLGPRVSYRRNPQRLGINRNFQKCLDEADGPLVTILGADDVMAPAFVVSMLTAAAAHPGAAMFQPAVRVVDGDGRPAAPLADRLKARLTPPRPSVLSGEELAVSLLVGNWMYFPATVFRTEVARAVGFRPGLDIVLDLELYLGIVTAGGSLVLLAEELFDYRRHEASLSSSERMTGARFTEESEYFARTADDLSRLGWVGAARAARWHLTSRLHAAALLPRAVAAKDPRWFGSLIRHVTHVPSRRRA